MPTDDQLRAKLIEDTGSAAEADRALPAVRRLADWPAPVPSARATTQLIRSLQATPSPRKPKINVWALLSSQARIVQQEIWLASVLVMSIGLWMAVGDSTSAPDGWLLALSAPVVTAIGIAFIYSSSADPALEIELAMPISSRLLLLARLMLVFSFDLALTLLASVILTMVQPHLSLWALIELWLAPLVCLTSLAFLLAAFFVDPLISTVVSLMLWALQVVRRDVPLFVPDLLSSEARPWLWLFAVVFGLAAVWLAGQEERWLIKRA
jgi:hypothetical protein